MDANISNQELRMTVQFDLPQIFQRQIVTIDPIAKGVKLAVKFPKSLLFQEKTHEYL